jgi:methyltransferase (TIGR00027 family)
MPTKDQIPCMINNVSDTAFWIAEYRANETDRPDALFRDPLARRLSGERGREIANSMPRSHMTAWTVVLRTVMIDNFILRAIEDGADVILNLGAGLDTRPYRMTLPATLRWIEVDFPHVIAFKDEKLVDQTPRCRLERVKIDLSDREARRAFLAATNATAQKILVLTEGVIPYLTAADVGTLADDLNATSNVEQWIVDYFSNDIMKMFQKRGQMNSRMQNAPFQFDPPDWFAFFLGHGWKVRQMKYMSDESERVHRPMPVPWFMRIVFRLRWMSMSAEKRMQLSRWAGYALMQRA